MENDFVRIKDIYEGFNRMIPMSTLYKIIVVDNRVPYVKIGRAVLVPRKAIEDYITNRTHGEIAVTLLAPAVVVNKVVTIAASKYPLTCSHCGNQFDGSLFQRDRSVQGCPVVCSASCRSRLNMRNRWGKSVSPIATTTTCTPSGSVLIT